MRCDAIVIGAGHNGLTSAAHMAKAGRSVLVLERADHKAGPTRSSKLPGLRREPVGLLLSALLEPEAAAESVVFRAVIRSRPTSVRTRWSVKSHYLP